MNMNFCPLCGSSELDEKEYRNDGNGLDVIILSQIYHCNNCKNDFRQVQKYHLKSTEWIIEK